MSQNEFFANDEFHYHPLETLSAVERKELEELKAYHSAEAVRKRERVVFFGYVAIAIISTLLISGAMNFQEWESIIW